MVVCWEKKLKFRPEFGRNFRPNFNLRTSIHLGRKCFTKSKLRSLFLATFSTKFHFSPNSSRNFQTIRDSLTLNVDPGEVFGDARVRILTEATTSGQQVAQIELEPNGQRFGGYFYLVRGGHLVDHATQFDQLLGLLVELLADELNLCSVAHQTVLFNLFQQLQLAAQPVQLVALFHDGALQLFW